MAVLDVVVPVYNEADCIEQSIRRLWAYLGSDFPFSAMITIADNASTDGTLHVANRLAEELPGVRVLHLDDKGRGRALKQAWSLSSSDVVAYMDVDLSTGLEALLPLVAPLMSGHSDIAIGTRLARGSHVVRGPRREIVSRAYNRLLRTVMQSRFSDAQCGFKAVRGALVPILMPLIEDNGWFFDTELLLVAERNSLRIHEVPVDWVDDPDSRVDLVATALGDLKGIWRLTRHFASGRARIGTDDHGDLGYDLKSFTTDAGEFARVGIPSTIAWLVMFLALRAPLGPVAANVVALSLSAFGNLAARRRSEHRAEAPHIRELELVALGSWTVAVASTTLAVIAASALSANWFVEILAAMTTGAVVSVGRFVVLRALLVRCASAGPVERTQELSRTGGGERT